MGELLSTRDLHERMVALRREQTRSEAELARLLAEFAARKGYRRMAHASIADYADIELGLSERQTVELLRIGRALPALPRVREAFESGEVPWTKIREIVRVATPDTEAGWVDEALQSSCRSLERKVAACQKGDPPPSDEDPIWPERVRMVFEVAATDAEDIRKALALLRARAGDDDVDPGVLLATAARSVLRESDSPEQPMPEERYRHVLYECTRCQSLTHVGTDGHHAVAPEVAAEAACDHDVVDMRPGPDQGKLSRSIPPRLRRAALLRDRCRCAVPGCENHLWVDVHHLRPREAGGRHDLANLIALCPAHHRAVHSDVLELRRDADGTVHAERPGRLATPDDPRMEGVLAMLALTALSANDIAHMVGEPRQSVERDLRWLERRGRLFRSPDGYWFAPGIGTWESPGVAA